MSLPPWLRAVVLPALLPSLLTLGFAAVLWRAVPGDFTPLWSDEVLYWNEAAAFLRAGFHAGYITVAEVAAPAAFSHFGPHGVGYAMLYGLVGRLIGWHANTQYLLHLLVIPLCAGVWFWVRRHQPGRLADALLVATFWPLLFYIPTGMTEPLQFGIAFLCAALLESPEPSRVNTAARVALVVVGTWLRPTWAFVIPALFLRPEASLRRWLAVLAVTAAAVPGALALWSWVSAPYPRSALLRDALAAPVSALGAVLLQTVANVRAFVLINQDWYVSVFRLELVLGLFVALLLFLRAASPDQRRRLILVFWLTVPVLASQFAGADIESGREFRIMAPHVLAALLVAAGLGVQWYALGPALAHLVLLPFLQTTYFNLHDGRFSRVREAVAFSEAIDGRLRFDPEAASGWDNTILMHVDALQPAVIGLPPGIGITFTLDWEEQPRRLKSRYL